MQRKYSVSQSRIATCNTFVTIGAVLARNPAWGIGCGWNIPLGSGEEDVLSSGGPSTPVRPAQARPGCHLHAGLDPDLCGSHPYITIARAMGTSPGRSCHLSRAGTPRRNWVCRRSPVPRCFPASSPPRARRIQSRCAGSFKLPGDFPSRRKGIHVELGVPRIESGVRPGAGGPAEASARCTQIATAVARTVVTKSSVLNLRHGLLDNQVGVLFGRNRADSKPKRKRVHKPAHSSSFRPYFLAESAI